MDEYPPPHLVILESLSLVMAVAGSFLVAVAPSGPAAGVLLVGRRPAEGGEQAADLVGRGGQPGRLDIVYPGQHGHPGNFSSNTPEASRRWPPYFPQIQACEYRYSSMPSGQVTICGWSIRTEPRDIPEDMGLHLTVLERLIKFSRQPIDNLCVSTVERLEPGDFGPCLLQFAGELVVERGASPRGNMRQSHLRGVLSDQMTEA